jgi:hypothetical protein
MIKYLTYTDADEGICIRIFMLGIRALHIGDN